jgi:predicted Zn finger-like uncharacterized protein
MRKRTSRRRDERDAKKLASAKWKLALLEDGFRADRPLVVDSPSQIEPHVRAMTCPSCGAPFRVEEHAATPGGRIVSAHCPQCGRTAQIYFVLRSATLS